MSRAGMTITLAGLVAACLAPAPAVGLRLGFFADPQGTSCSLTLPPNTLATVYLLAILDAPEETGVTGAEFRIVWPVSVSRSWNPNPQVTLWAGSDETGNVWGWRLCQSGDGRIVQLATATIWTTGIVTDAVVRIEAATMPGNAAFQCPLGTLCDVEECPAATTTRRASKVCAQTVDLVVNGTCTTDVAPAALGFGLASRNPARGAADLRFDLAQPGRVRLAIYDVAGREVRRLLDAERAAGQHTVAWDGQDDAGRRLPSGVYFARLTRAAAVEGQRIVLLP